MTYAIPPYPEKHDGRAIIVGSAAGVFEEFEEAREAWPDAEVIAVNEAIAYFKAGHFATQHFEKLPLFRRLAANNWPGHELTFHTQVWAGMPQQWAGFYCWPCMSCGGGSGWAAARLAEALGFEEIVLCGVPLDPKGYAWPTDRSRPDDPRVGVKADICRNFARHIECDKLQGIGDRVRSMSGRTREILGGPSWL